MNSLLRRIYNRVLHLLARNVPGSTSFRPFLHRLRGIKIGNNVFIGDEVYLENEYPNAIEIQDGVHISVRATIIAHTRGPGKVIIEKDAFIGPNTAIVASAGRTLKIGEGAVIGAGVVVTNNISPHMFVVNDSAKVIAKALVPFTKAEKPEDFVRSLVPIRSRSRTKDAKN